MNEEKLRIAIARAVGPLPMLHYFYIRGHDEGLSIQTYRSDPEAAEDTWSELASSGNPWMACTPLEEIIDAPRIPDYCGERDAAIEAVIELCDTEEKESLFALHLTSVCADDKRGCHQVGFAMLTAKPLQICTALAKCLNLEIE